MIQDAKAAIIANPRAGRGKALGLYGPMKPALEDALAPAEFHVTTGPAQATKITQTALKRGANQIAVFGGDGTLNEVVNGFFDEGGLINPDAELLIVMAGTGSDFVRNFPAPKNQKSSVEELLSRPSRFIDVGRANYASSFSARRDHYFVNVFSWGLSSLAGSAANIWSLPALGGGRYAYMIPSLLHGVLFQNQLIAMSIDDEPVEEMVINTLSVCNGQFFGGGMRMAPLARLDDGELDLVLIKDVNLLDLSRQFPKIYRGEHLGHRKIEYRRIRKIEISSVRGRNSNLPLNLDGEMHGTLPVSLEILPSALRVRI